MLFIFKNSILNTSRTVLANYTAFSGLHKTAYAVLIEKHFMMYHMAYAETSEKHDE